MLTLISENIFFLNSKWQNILNATGGCYWTAFFPHLERYSAVSSTRSHHLHCTSRSSYTASTLFDGRYQFVWTCDVPMCSKFKRFVVSVCALCFVASCITLTDLFIRLCDAFAALPFPVALLSWLHTVFEMKLRPQVFHQCRCRCQARFFFPISRQKPIPSSFTRTYSYRNRFHGWRQKSEFCHLNKFHSR